MLKEIEVSNFDNTVRCKYTGSAQPYVIAFVYSRCGEKCVVKGMAGPVKEYIEKKYPLALINMSYWQGGKSWNSWSGSYRQFSVMYDKGKGKYRVNRYDKDGTFTFYLKRMPHKWIPEFDLQ